jgi:hypothetical protein
MTQNAPPIMTGNQYHDNSHNYPHQSHYPHHEQYSQQYSHPGQYAQQYSHPGHHEHYNQGYYPQSYSNDYYTNPMMAYGDHSPAEQYFHDHSSPGMYSDLAHEYGFGDEYHQYQGQFHTPYHNYNNYSNNPNIMHDYL